MSKRLPAYMPCFSTYNTDKQYISNSEWKTFSLDWVSECKLYVFVCCGTIPNVKVQQVFFQF